MVRRIKAKLVLQLRAEGLSGRAISAGQGISRRSVAAVVEAADRLGISFDDIADQSDEQVYRLLFPGRGEHHSVFVEPDWGVVHKELAKVGVTLKLLHGEYRDSCSSQGSVAMSYDRFCRRYQQYTAMIGVSSRVAHKAAQTVEVDWSGPTMELVDPVTGACTKVYLFVATLPFSRYSYVHATTDMGQQSWLRCHVAMFDAFGGSVPRIVPDNLKTGVLKHPRDGEIVLNDAYRELAAHYSAAVLPTRVKKPKDKPSVENTVSHVATWVIAALRNERFSTLAQLQAAIDDKIAAYNRAPFQKRVGSRLGVFTTEEKPLLIPLPPVRYEVCKWVYGRKVARNSHVSFERNYYSAPMVHVGARVDLRITERTVEIYRGPERVSSHLRLPEGAVNRYRTNTADVGQDKQFQPFDKERVIAWASRIGPATTEVIHKIFESFLVDQQGIDPALAVLRLARKYSHQQLEHACHQALQAGIRSPRYGHIAPIITNQNTGTNTDNSRATSYDHGGFVRGQDYYAQGETR